MIGKTRTNFKLLDRRNRERENWEKGENAVVDCWLCDGMTAAERVGGAKYELLRDTLSEDRTIYSSGLRKVNFRMCPGPRGLRRVMTRPGSPFYHPSRVDMTSAMSLGVQGNGGSSDDSRTCKLNGCGFSLRGTRATGRTRQPRPGRPFLRFSVSVSLAHRAFTFD